MLRKEKFIPGEYYHIYSRVILNSPEFRNKTNAQKLSQSFLLANSTNSSRAFDYLRTGDNPNFDTAVEIAQKGKRFVDILCYSIMPDHYHLLLKEKTEKGITNFLQRCNTSISKYINKKKSRTGPLFESRFKSKHVDSNTYLLHLSVYIHLNPLDIIDGRNWRENKLNNWPKVKEKLLLYPWSSLNAFLDKDYKDLIISGTEVILDQFDDAEEYENFLRSWTEINNDELGNFLFD